MPIQLTFDGKKENRVQLSSIRMDWQTPEWLYNKLNEEFHFDYDPCPTEAKENGLKTCWGDCSFVNPPYGRHIGHWVKKAYQESKKGKTVVMLVPSRTDVSWWHDYVMNAEEIRYIRKRLRFRGAKNSAPFPSAVIIFRGAK